MRKVLFISLLLISFLLSSLSKAIPSLMKRGDVEIKKAEEFEDVVVAEGRLINRGRIKGSVFVVKGEIFLEQGSMVEGGITLIGGNLFFGKGATVKGGIHIFNGRAELGEANKPEGEFQVIERVSSLDSEKLNWLSNYLVFERVVPEDKFYFEEIEKLDLKELGLSFKKKEKIYEFELPELGDISFRAKGVEFSESLEFRGTEPVEIVLIDFQTKEDAERFFSLIRKRFEHRISYSIHNGLGEGAHWFFRYEGKVYSLWTKEDKIVSLVLGKERHRRGEREFKKLESFRDELIFNIFALWKGSKK